MSIRIGVQGGYKSAFTELPHRSSSVFQQLQEQLASTPPPLALFQRKVSVIEPGQCAQLPAMRYLSPGGQGRSSLDPLVEAVGKGDLKQVRALFPDIQLIPIELHVEAMTEAAGKGQLNIVRYLLPEEEVALQMMQHAGLIAAAQSSQLAVLRHLLFVRECSPQMFALTVHSAACSGSIAAVRFLCPDVREMAPELVGLCLIEASREGHHDVVDYLLPGEWKILPEALDGAIQQALEGSHLDVLDRLLLAKLKISQDLIQQAEDSHIESMQQLYDELGICDESRWEAVLAAVRSDHLKVVERLWSDGVSFERRVLAINAAAERGHLQVLRFLMPQKHEDFELLRGLAFIRAAESGHLLSELFTEEWEISESVRSRAAIAAAGSGHRSIVSHLWKGGMGMAPTSQEAILLEAVERGHADIVSDLFSDWPGEVPKSLCHTALLEAAENGKSSVIYFLLSRDWKISPQLLEKVLLAAVRAGTFFVVRDLFTKWRREISPSLRASALIEAAKHNHNYVVSFLRRENGKILPQLQAKVVLAAAENGSSMTLVNLLDAWRELPVGVRIKALLVAVKRGYFEAVRHIVRRMPRIERWVHAEVMKEAAERGHAGIVGFLLDLPLSKALRAECLRAAKGNGHQDIVEMLTEGGSPKRVDSDAGKRTPSDIDLDAMETNARKNMPA